MSSTVVGLHHPAIVVPDLAAAIHFYGKFAGYEVVIKRDWDADSDINRIIGLDRSVGTFAVLRNDHGFLELFEFQSPSVEASPEPPAACDLGIRHLCFQVADMSRALEQLSALGGAAMNEPVANSRGVTSVYARDPFGNLIELLATGGAIEGLEHLKRTGPAVES